MVCMLSLCISACVANFISKLFILKNFTISSYHTKFLSANLLQTEVKKHLTNISIWLAYIYILIVFLQLYTTQIICNTLCEYPLLSSEVDTHAQTHTHTQQQKANIFACTWYCSVIVYLSVFKCMCASVYVYWCT